ncbi:YhdH/YhfP family quinone oxidoreductase [uncultured Vagococcus sp.]|uniref:YhdH/YhfP family quinone oxidoreductase n=1 Tax=uncultured Vagococcus sp. TaxID=189676 RepID=UPI0028D34750|nr:YhdH/YhfP family quinone oxidoreductase [uncultured Vagococcus sp.]
MENFNALWLEKHEGELIPRYRQTHLDELSAGDLLIKVAYSSVNFKDALASQEASGVVRHYPIIPGIDLSGTIIDPGPSEFKVGQEVIVTGYGLGVSHSGGYSEIARVPAEWVIPLPIGLGLKEAMIFGTAGLTAALSVNALEKQGLRQHKEAEILVTGASGGVGSLAIGILKSLGYHNITALSRKKEQSAAYFTELGVKAVVTAEEISPDKQRPLMKQVYNFVLDTVGGRQLETIIPQIAYDGSISLCGNAGGIAFSSTVLPYILRGVNILGIDSVNISNEHRLYIWNRLATDMMPATIQQFAKNEIVLEELPVAFQQLLAGTMTGRNLVRIAP